MTRGSPTCTCSPIRLEAVCSRTRARVAMKAVPISPPISRAVCSAAPKVSASCGRRCRTAEEDDAGEGEALAEGLQQLRRQELVRAPERRQIVGHHQAGEADEDEADARHTSRGSVRRSINAGQRAEDQLRRGDPDQASGPPPGPESRAPPPETAGSEGGRQDGQPKERDQQQQASAAAAEARPSD